MKFSLPILTMVASLAPLPYLAAADPGQALPSRQPEAARDVDGQDLIRQAAIRLRELPRIEANVRQRIDLFGQQLSGPGYYSQYGDGSGKVRLQLKLALSGQMASFQQISDGRFLYTQIEMPGSKRRVSFVDTQRIRKAMRRTVTQVTPQPTANWMALGGLSYLLGQLDEHFLFTTAKANSLGDGKIPVWTIHGTWKPEKLAQMLPDQQEAILAGQPARLEDLSSNLPHAVAVTLGRDRRFPLFPYRLVYYQQAPGVDKKRQKVAPHPILSLELFNVRQRADMKASEFDYQPDDNELVDQTNQILQRLGLAPDDKSIR